MKRGQMWVKSLESHIPLLHQLYIEICLTHEYIVEYILLYSTGTHYLGQSSEFGLPLPQVQGVSFDSTGLMGQIAGVTTDKQGNVYVFHRAERVWDYK